ncbi:unnamed protein product [Linum trigynum]|uniref:Uncharacterized protein n=1 Tax=Linum trigynum TaxID=586398 RepID=A0AAV2GLH5_9ROSI
MSDHLRSLGFVHTYISSIHREPSIINHHLYLEHFDQRPLAFQIRIDPHEFIPFGMDIMPLISALGWEFLINLPAQPACPELVKHFYSNLRCLGIQTKRFSTLVYGHLLSIPMRALSIILGYPSSGLALSHTSEMWKFDFNLHVEGAKFSGQPVGSSFEVFPASRLCPKLRIFHYFLTRVLLPRGYSRDQVLPLDIWVISHATAGQKLDYCSLLFGAMVSPGEGSLPFGGIVTTFLANININISGFRSESPTIHLSARNVLTCLGFHVPPSPTQAPLRDPANLGLLFAIDDSSSESSDEDLEEDSDSPVPGPSQ